MARRVTLIPYVDDEHRMLVEGWLRDPACYEWVSGTVLLEHALNPINGCDVLLVLDEQGTPVGVLSLNEFSFPALGTTRGVEVAIAVASDQRRAGVGTAALLALAGHPDYENAALAGEVHRDNPASVRCLTKAGFVFGEQDDDGYRPVLRAPDVTRKESDDQSASEG